MLILYNEKKNEVDRNEFICTLVAISQTISYKACTVISNFKKGGEYESARKEG